MSSFLRWGGYNMVVPILLGAGAGLALGYISDHLFGDGEYSGGEALFDVAGGALGGAVMKPIGVMAGRAFTVGRAHASTATSFAISTVDDAVGAAAAIASGQLRPIGIGVTTGYFGDQYTRMKMSSDPRSERNASNVGSGGTSSGRTVKPSVPSTTIKAMGMGKVSRKACPKGYRLVKHKGRFVCLRDDLVILGNKIISRSR
ncbi:MAG: hypothetical protein [Circular genetic element sp.]|nr:MAG: hypothetical protein [Circular genetic element sp.]